MASGILCRTKMLGRSILHYIEKIRKAGHCQLTFKAEEVPTLFREPGVLTGYRIPNQSLKYYIFSMFQIHNETVNIWTHLIAFLIVLGKTLDCVRNYNAENPQFPVFLGFGICCLFYTFFSTVAHTIHSMSPYVHYKCYQADYAGIGFYMLGSSFLLYYASCHKDYYDVLELSILPFNIVMSWFGFICCCMAKLLYRRPYPFQRKLWQLGSFGTQVLCTSFIVIARYLDCWNDTSCSVSSLNHHTLVYFFMFASIFFFSSHIPEKLWPGKFDMVGQGHQLFHILVTIATLLQYRAASIDFAHHSTVFKSHKPYLFHILTSVFLYAVLSFVTVICLTPFTLKRIRSDYESENMSKLRKDK
ncbi:hypothetical protein KUTeg_015850 [Tegillarca granosa]|uniref:Uncharacterized protein n=1 Tax=Tegillarca granosa TaxID=220873 RepID=A0ABQ9EP16_TEGGR|nr:hypothetical protein KUTeg_015850 [Tegillarca granosa]